MPQFNAQTTITNLENRLLKAEGQILALRSIVQSTLTTDDVSSGIMRTQLEAIEKALTKEVSNREHDPAARKFIEAAQQLVVAILAAGPNARPNFSVIDGRKSDDQ